MLTNKPDAVNPAITLRLTIKDQWRRAADLERQAASRAMKPSLLLVLAWLLICLGCLAILGGPVFALSRSGYDPLVGWVLQGVGETLTIEGPTEKDVALQSIPFVAAGVFMVFIGTFLRQRSLRQS